MADTWKVQDGSYHVAANAASAVAEPVIFGLLGAAFASQVGWDELGYGLALTAATVFLVRPIVAAAGTVGSGLTHGERMLVSWGGLKGAVPLLLAAYPALDNLEGAAQVEGTVLVATVASVLLQGATLSAVASRARRPRRRAPGPKPGRPRRANDLRSRAGRGRSTDSLELSS